MPGEPALRAYYGLALGYAADFRAGVAPIRRAGLAPRGDTTPTWGAVLFLLAAGDETAARDLARRVKREDTPLRLDEALLALLEGHPHHAAWTALGVARRAGAQEVLARERALAIAALASERTGLPGRRLARTLWRDLAGSRTALASMARRRLRSR